MEQMEYETEISEELETVPVEETEMQDDPATVADDMQRIYDLLDAYVTGNMPAEPAAISEIPADEQAPEDELMTHGADIAVVMLLGMIFGLSLWGAFSRRFFA